MENVLVTGADGILGYHTIKLLNRKGIKPKGLVSIENEDLAKDKDPAKSLAKFLAKSGLCDLKVDIVGSVTDLQVLRKACQGMDTVFHMSFGLSLGDGSEAIEAMDKKNIEGTHNLIEAATEAGVKTVVVSSSSLTIGLNPEPQPLNEATDWATPAFNLPYAVSRRDAELIALAAEEGPDRPKVVVINPSFTMGPKDYKGAPANKLAKLIGKGMIKLNVPIGFGLLDVRDYAEGALLAAEKGLHGQSYILSGENVEVPKFINKIYEIKGLKPPGFLLSVPVWTISPLITLINIFGKIIGKETLVSPSILELWNQHAFYNTSKARDELGWQPRPLEETIRDSLQWVNCREK